MADETKIGKRKKQEKDEKNCKRQRTSRKKKPGFSEDIYKETEHIVKNGLRHVKPYYFTFTSYCKGRWLRRKLLDVLAEEFQAKTAEYYSNAIKNGNIRVNGNVSSEDLILKDNDIITHKVHRHEPPVTADQIQIIQESDDIFVVNKPSSIPIHPCGRYRHNTLVFLLAREFGMTNLHTIHRIDRLTSGIVIFSKSLAKTQTLEKQLRDREMQKEYICKVHREFPSEVIDCNEPISVVSHKVGVCRVDPKGKSCRTVFTRESYDGITSIVRCQPHTGRMHQIRVHLQWLGYPIIDDPIYNHEAWGADKGKGGVDEEIAWKVIESIATALRNNDSNHADQMSKTETCKTEENAQENAKERNYKDEVDTIEPQSKALQVGNKESSLSEEGANETENVQKVESCSELENEKCLDCSECNIQRPDPTPEELSMCLHAASYKGPDWEYTCPPPAWCTSG